MKNSRKQPVEELLNICWMNKYRISEPNRTKKQLKIFLDTDVWEKQVNEKHQVYCTHGNRCLVSWVMCFDHMLGIISQERGIHYIKGESGTWLKRKREKGIDSGECTLGLTSLFCTLDRYVTLGNLISLSPRFLHL